MSASNSANLYSRQGPLSPSSPSPESLHSHRKLNRPTPTLPQTPTSPPLMSTSSQQHGSQTQLSSSTATSQQFSATPPSTLASTVGTSTQYSQQHAPHALGGTATSKTQSNSNDDDHHHFRMLIDGEDEDSKRYSNEQDSGEMDIDRQEHRRTDHDRQNIDSEAMDSGISDSKVKIEGSMNEGIERGTRDREGLIAAGKSNMDWLRADVGTPYLLCRSPHPKSRPHPTQDLLSLYSLKALAATVARQDPVTGEKKKLRKSYKGKIMEFNLAGRNDSVKHPEGQPGGLLEMLNYPDGEWINQRVSNRKMESGFNEATLERALKMEPGPLPDFDVNMLGLDLESTVVPVPVPSSKKSGQQALNNFRQNASVAQTNGATPHSADSPSADPARPKRTGKKRRYDDRSFEGYGEGYVDDEVEMGAGGYSTGDGEDGRRMGKKKRKKNLEDYAGASPRPGLGDRGGSYGVGMMGVGSGIGAYSGR